MKMKKQPWTSFYGNKGRKAFILTLDALLSFVIFLIAFAAISSYLSQGENVMPDMQTSRAGSDMVRLLENTNIIQTLDSGLIWTGLIELLPEKYGMGLNISWSAADLGEGGSFEVGNEMPDKTFVAAGKRFFVVTNETAATHYGMAKYWIWLK